jgi:hypothetical protein
LAAPKAIAAHLRKVDAGRPASSSVEPPGRTENERHLDVLPARLG